METILLNLYQQRLEHLTTTIDQLQDIVLADQASHLLIEQDLLRYKVDRVNELVREVMHHERQKLLLAALTRCASLTEEQKRQKEQAEEGMQMEKQVREQYVCEMKVLKNHNQQLKTKVIEMEKAGEEEKRRVSDRVRAEKQSGLRQRQRQLEERDEKQRKEIEGKNKIIRELSLQHNSLEEEVSRLKNFFRESPPEGYNIRAEKMTSLKKQIKTLTAHLSSIQTSFSLIKQSILNHLLNDLATLHKTVQSLGRYALQEIQRARMDIERSMAQGIKTHFKREDELVKRVNELDNELDYFIERHIET